MRPGLLLAALLAVGCVDPYALSGAEVEHFEVRGRDGTLLGSSVVMTSGGILRERTTVEGAAAGDIVIESIHDPSTGTWQIRRQVGREVDELRFDAQGRMLLRQKGLAIEVTSLDLVEESVFEDLQIPGALPVGSVLVWRTWAKRVASLDSEDVAALDLRSGNRVSVRVERRQQARLGGERALRYFVRTPALGATLWVTLEGRLLSVETPLGRIIAPGIELPRPSRLELPEGLIEESLEVVREDVTLSGTLTLPVGGARSLPLVLLVHGSGPMDRDESPFMIFRDLAWTLPSRGFAVLRYDKRGIGESRLRGERDVTLPALIGDARAWIERMDGHPDIDASCRIVLGHSEGGYVALRLGRERVVDAAVLLAGPVQPLTEVIAQQTELIFAAHGAPQADIESARRRQDLLFGRIRRNQPPPGMTEGLGADVFAWLRSHQMHDPKADLEGLTVPLFALYAGGDLQVPISQAELMMEHARVHHASRIDVEIVSGFDHLFMDVGGMPGIGVLADPDRRMNPVVNERIGAWLTRLPCAMRAP